MLCLGLAVALLWGPPGAAWAASPSAGDLAVERQAALAPVHAAELAFGGGPFQARPLQGRFGRSRLPSQVGPVWTRVVREIPALWRLRVPKDVDPGDIRVSYELVSEAGQRAALSHDRAARGWIELVRARALRPVVIQDDGDEVLLEGSVLLELDVAHARFSGDYHGLLTVRVTPPNR